MSSRVMLPRVLTGTNQEYARLHNRCAVLDAIRQAGQLTRAELKRVTGLSAQTVSNIVAELEREGMLLAHAPRTIPQGQPPIPFSLNPEGGFSIGIHITGHRLTSVLMDLTGRIRATRVDATEQSTRAEVTPLIQQIASALRAGFSDARILGMGIALAAPGCSDPSPATGFGDAPAWGGPTSVAALEVETGLPVLVESDANAAAAGERLYGAARNLRDFAYLFIGHELRAVLFIANQLHVGRCHNAGQIGHLAWVTQGRPCPCGKRGCLGGYLSEACLLQDLGVDTRRCLDGLDLDGNPGGVQRFLEHAVPAFRYATDMLESLLDPEGIVVGGTIPHAILQTLVERAQPAGAAGPHGRIQLGRAGAECVALGAASVVMLAQFSSDPGNVA